MSTLKTMQDVTNINGEKCKVRITDLSNPIECRLEGVCATFLVYGIARRRNYTEGKVLSLAVGSYVVDGRERKHDIRDIGTMMKLSDKLSHLHELPVNADKLYGKLGRGFEVK